MEKATAGAADIVIFDLEDAVADGGEAQGARHGRRAFLAAQPKIARGCGCGSIRSTGPHTLADLAAIDARHVPAASCCPSLAAGRTSSCWTTTCRRSRSPAASSTGSTKVIVLVTETAEGMFTTGDYAGAPRVVAMTWGAEDLADAIGRQREPQRRRRLRASPTSWRAASACSAPRLPACAPIETIQGDFRD